MDDGSMIIKNQATEDSRLAFACAIHVHSQYEIVHMPMSKNGLSHFHLLASTTWKHDVIIKPEVQKRIIERLINGYIKYVDYIKFHDQR